MIKNTYQTFGIVTKSLHFIIALLIICMLIVGSTMDDFKIPLIYTIHKLTGLLVLIITLYFICWRSLNEKPAYGITIPRWERIAAKSVQHTMLLLALIMSLSGWFFSTAKNKSPALLGYEIPMPGVIISKSWAKVGTTIHYYAAWLLFALICIHVLAALKHYFYDKDNILQRMFWE